MFLFVAIFFILFLMASHMIYSIFQILDNTMFEW